MPTGIVNSAVRLSIYATTAGIKRYQSINKKKINQYDKTAFLARITLNCIEVLVSKALIDS